MLEDKVCVVTGSGGGIGRATAVEMARQGARIVVTDLNDEGGQETVRLVQEVGGEAEYIHCDVTKLDQGGALMEGAAKRFGGIDVLHNNAGVHESDFTDQLTIDTLPEDVWDKVYEINLKSVWMATKAAAPY